MTGFLVLLRKELLEQWRTHRLPVIGLVFLVVGISSPLLAFYTPQLLEEFAAEVEVVFPEPSARDALDQLLGNLGLVALISAILLAMGSVAREKESGTAALVLSKPVGRPAFLLAKLIALGATMTTGVALAGAATYLYTAILFETLPMAGYVVFCGLVLLTYLVTMTVTFLGSVVLRSAMGAAGIGVGGFVVLLTLSAIPVVGEYSPMALPGPAMALALGEAAGGVAKPLISSIVLISLAWMAAWVSFRKQPL